MFPPFQFHTNRLLIRPIKELDAVAVFSYRSDRVTNQYQSWIPTNEKDVIDFIEKTTTDFNIPDTWFQAVMIQKETNELIGDIGIHFIGEDNEQVELGCTLARMHQRKGFATEALFEVIRHLFVDFKKHRIMASVDPRNINSVNLMEQLGFRKEAHFHQSMLIHGEWVDDLVFAMLQKEWLNQFG